MIQAIETEYKGYRFRSRLEARWAVFFDALDVRWEYEKEGYDLGGLARYLPDFWLTDLKLWIEIKGQRPTSIEMLKLDALARMSDSNAYLFVGEPDIGDPFPYMACVWLVNPGDKTTALETWVGDDVMMPFHYCWLHDILGLGDYFDYEFAINAARSARFEHGETPRFLRGKPRK